MTIQQNKENSKLTVALAGSLDTATAPQLESELTPNLDGVQELILDCAELDYVSSAGLRVILGLQQILENQGTMKLTHVNDSIMEVFDITGFLAILTVE